MCIYDRIKAKIKDLSLSHKAKKINTKVQHRVSKRKATVDIKANINEIEN